MTRSFLSLILALAAETLVLLAAGEVSGQPQYPTFPNVAPAAAQCPELRDAVKLISQGKTSEGYKKLEEASRKHPEFPSAHVMMFKVWGETSTARRDLELAVRESPGDPEPFICLGGIALRERRMAEAVLDLEKAKQLLAACHNASRKAIVEQELMSGFAGVSELRAEWKEAETGLRAYLKLSPDDLCAHQRLARSLFRQGKLKESTAALGAANAINRKNADRPGERQIGLTLNEVMGITIMGFDRDESDRDESDVAKIAAVDLKLWFEEALENTPHDFIARLDIARWALKHGKVDIAKEQADTVLRIRECPEGYIIEGHILRGQVALWEKDWPTAEAHFEKVLIEVPNSPSARNGLALALAEQNDPQKKQRALEYAAANSFDRGPDTLATLGWIYFRRNEFDAADKTLEEAIKAGRGKISGDTATYRAHVFHHAGQDWQAKITLDAILKSDRPFSMRPEAQKLYEKVKEAKRP